MAVAQDLPQLEPRAVQARPELGRLRRRRHAARRRLTGNEKPDPARVGRRSRRSSRRRWSRSRTSASTSTAASTSWASPGRSAGHPRRARCRAPRRSPSSSSRTRSTRPGQPHRPAEAPRGGARLPARAPVVEGQDPHRVPEQRSTSATAPTASRRPPRPTSAGTTPAAADRADRAPSQLLPWEAAMLAGMISSPTAYDPARTPTTRCAAQPRAAEHGDQGVPRPQDEYDAGDRGDPGSDHEADHARRRRTRQAPYFTSWLRQQLVDQVRRRRGVRRRPADQVDARSRPPATKPSRIVSGPRWRGSGRRPPWSCSTTRPATCSRWSAARTTRRPRSTSRRNGHRQPGSSFKPFTLVTALEQGHSPDRGLHLGAAGDPVQGEGRRRRTARATRSSTDLFQVNNYDDNYLGSAPDHHGDHLLRQLRVLAARDPGRAAERRRDRRRWGSRPTSRPRPVLDRGRPVRALQPGADPRRPRDRASRRSRWRTRTTRSPPAASGSRARCANAGGTGRDHRRHRRRRSARSTDQQGDPVPDETGANGVNKMVAKQVIDPTVAPTAKYDPLDRRLLGHRDTCRRPATRPGARPAPPTTTATPGSAVRRRGSPPASGSAIPDSVTPMETEFGGAPGRRRDLPGPDLLPGRQRLRLGHGLRRGPTQGERRRVDSAITEAPTTYGSTPPAPRAHRRAATPSERDARRARARGDRHRPRAPAPAGTDAGGGDTGAGSTGGAAAGSAGGVSPG